MADRVSLPPVRAQTFPHVAPSAIRTPKERRSPGRNPPDPRQQSVSKSRGDVSDRGCGARAYRAASDPTSSSPTKSTSSSSEDGVLASANASALRQRLRSLGLNANEVCGQALLAEAARGTGLGSPVPAILSSPPTAGPGHATTPHVTAAVAAAAIRHVSLRYDEDAPSPPARDEATRASLPPRSPTGPAPPRVPPARSAQNRVAPPSRATTRSSHSDGLAGETPRLGECSPLVSSLTTPPAPVAASPSGGTPLPAYGVVAAAADSSPRAS